MKTLERDRPKTGNTFQYIGLGGANPLESVVMVIDFSVSDRIAKNAYNEPHIDAGCVNYEPKWLLNPSQGSCRGLHAKCVEAEDGPRAPRQLARVP